MEEDSSAFKCLTDKPIGNKPLRPRRRREDNVRTDLKVIGASWRNWIDLLKARVYLRALVYAALSLWVP